MIRNLVVYSLVAGLMLLLGFPSVYKASIESELRTDIFELAESEITKISLRGGDRAKAIAIFVPGFQVNKSYYTQFAKFLAFSNITSYLVDLPGQGSSRVRNTKNALEVVRSMVNQLLDRSGASFDQLALLGHSLGGGIAIDLGMEYPDLASVVLLGPGYRATTPETPKNILLVDGEHEKGFIKKNIASIAQESTGGSDLASGILWGSFSDGTARKIVNIPSAGHIGILYDQSSHQQVRDWILSSVSRGNPAIGKEIERSEKEELAPVITVICVLVSFLLATLMVVTIHRIVPSTQSYPLLFPDRSFREKILWLCVGMGMGCFLVRYFIPLQFVPIFEGNEITSLFFLSGCMAFIPLLLSSRGNVASPGVRRTLISFCVALLVFLTLYGVSLVYLSREFFFLTFEGREERIAPLVIFSVALFPFFLLVEDALRSFQMRWESDSIFPWRTLGLSLVLAVLFGVTYYLGVAPVTRRFTAAFALGVLYLLVLASFQYRESRNILVTSMSHTMVLSWVISVGFFIF